MILNNRHYKIIISSVLGLLLVIAGYFGYVYVEKGYAPIYPNNIVSHSTTISKSEFVAFLKIWPRYKDSGLDKVGVSQFTKSDVEDVNPKASRWLKRKGWNVERFYYVEQRVRVIIDTIKKDDFILKNNHMIMAQAQGGGNSEVAGALLKLAQSEYKKLNIEKITPDERAMIAPKVDEVIAIIRGSEKK